MLPGVLVATTKRVDFDSRADSSGTPFGEAKVLPLAGAAISRPGVTLHAMWRNCASVIGATKEVRAR
jgi:hypothetical protein